MKKLILLIALFISIGIQAQRIVTAELLQLKGITEPTDTVFGRVYLNSADSSIYYWNGTMFFPLDSLSGSSGNYWNESGGNIFYPLSANVTTPVDDSGTVMNSIYMNDGFELNPASLPDHYVAWSSNSKRLMSWGRIDVVPISAYQNNTANINAAIEGNGYVYLVIDTTMTLTDNWQWPDSLIVDVKNGGSIDVNGHSLFLSDADLSGIPAIKWLTYVKGTDSINADSARYDKAYPEWIGVTENIADSSNNVGRFQAMVDAFTKVYAEADDYYIDSTITIRKDNHEFHIAKQTTIRNVNTDTVSFFRITKPSVWFDGGGGLLYQESPSSSRDSTIYINKSYFVNVEIDYDVNSGKDYRFPFRITDVNIKSNLGELEDNLYRLGNVVTGENKLPNGIRINLRTIADAGYQSALYYAQIDNLKIYGCDTALYIDGDTAAIGKVNGTMITDYNPDMSLRWLVLGDFARGNSVVNMKVQAFYTPNDRDWMKAVGIDFKSGTINNYIQVNTADVINTDSMIVFRDGTHNNNIITSRSSETYFRDDNTSTQYQRSNQINGYIDIDGTGLMTMRYPFDTIEVDNRIIAGDRSTFNTDTVVNVFGNARIKSSLTYPFTSIHYKSGISYIPYNSGLFVNEYSDDSWLGEYYGRGTGSYISLAGKMTDGTIKEWFRLRGTMAGTNSGASSYGSRGGVIMEVNRGDDTFDRILFSDYQGHNYLAGGDWSIADTRVSGTGTVTSTVNLTYTVGSAGAFDDMKAGDILWTDASPDDGWRKVTSIGNGNAGDSDTLNVNYKWGSDNDGSGLSWGYYPMHLNADDGDIDIRDNLGVGNDLDVTKSVTVGTMIYFSYETISATKTIDHSVTYISDATTGAFILYLPVYADTYGAMLRISNHSSTYTITVKPQSGERLDEVVDGTVAVAPGETLVIWNSGDSSIGWDNDGVTTR